MSASRACWLSLSVPASEFFEAFDMKLKAIFVGDDRLC